ncbi:hypothetical protein FOZ63_004344, partial [Perkinsus olseni]
DMAFHVQSGRFAVLNNCRCLTRYPDEDPEKLSRGRLVESVASGTRIPSATTHFDPYYLFYVDNTYTAKPSLRVYNHAPKHPSLTTSSVAWDDSVREIAEEVFVKSNEAPWCEHPWPKSQFLEERGRKLISELPDYSSLEDVTAAVAEINGAPLPRRYLPGRRIQTVSGGWFRHRSLREAKIASRTAQFRRPCSSWTVNSRQLTCGCGPSPSTRVQPARSARGQNSNLRGLDSIFQSTVSMC